MTLAFVDERKNIRVWPEEAALPAVQHLIVAALSNQSRHRESEEHATVYLTSLFAQPPTKKGDGSFISLKAYAYRPEACSRPSSRL
jgi:hypothetical protein